MELNSLVELLLSRVRLRARRRALWLAHLGGGTEQPTLATYLDGRDTPESETAWYEENEAIRSLDESLSGVEDTIAGPAGEPLRQLADLFRLSVHEVDLFEACVAAAIDPALAAAFSYLQFPGRAYVTEGLAARLFNHGRRVLLHPTSPLALWAFVSAGEAPPGEPPPLSADPVVLSWLQGDLRMDPALVGRVKLVEARSPLGSWAVDSTADWVRRVIERGALARVVLIGPTGSGRKTMAAAVAARFGLQTLAVDTSGVADPDLPSIYMRAQRMAILGGAALAWHGDRLDRPWPNVVAPSPLQFVTCDIDQVVPRCDYVVDHRVEVSVPTLEERCSLWKLAVSESAMWPAQELETLATRYRLNTGDVLYVGAQAPASARQAADLARERTRHQLGELARLLDCPFEWDDLVLPEKLRDALEDFAFEASERSSFWESKQVQRLFPRGTGLVALFNGPPGTGKTMAAQVIAAGLALDLLRIDLASVVSKYIGETAKHLARIFSRGARMNGVLLFDEADALFSKRTEVKDSHDRYANADTSYLLQLLEDYRGIVILATNRKQNIDPAFLRRMRYVFDFPRPDSAERQLIWSQVIGELCGAETLERIRPGIKALGANVELSGAQIKNAVLASIFIARRTSEPLGMAHLLRGIDRELGKEGRAIGARERERLLSHV